MFKIRDLGMSSEFSAQFTLSEVKSILGLERLLRALKGKDPTYRVVKIS